MSEIKKQIFKAELFGHKYKMEFETKEEFETWLETKVETYSLSPIEKRLWQKALGMDIMMDRIKVLEEKIK